VGRAPEAGHLQLLTLHLERLRLLDEQTEQLSQKARPR
jgi:hypothetical protein